MPGMQMQMGQPVPGVGPDMLPGGYPGYPAYSAGYSSDAEPMWTYFTAVAGQDGEVDAEELQRCLTQSGISETYSPFSLETCRIMIAMLDRDYTGKMGFNEFKELWAALSAWKQNFVTIDQDRSGTVEHHELSQAIAVMVRLTGVLMELSKTVALLQLCDFMKYISTTMPIPSTVPSKMLEIVGFSSNKVS
ncbi:PREDICTED: grancalcin [Propithecus coquereli]|uniref:grancalcin n=1 Tax=Propithecus coquereli TaxID=379532 RepID=UPI00063F2049|nr:PREDICTED: grancalcin [Propithecus coquereli]